MKKDKKMQMQTSSDIKKKTSAIKKHILTDARIAMGDVQIRIGKREGFDLKAAQVPIDYYYNRKLITHLEYIAANKLFRDFVISGQIPGMISNLDSIRGGYRGITQSQMEARQRWRDAIDSIHGTIGQLMALNVCCYGYWLKDGINNKGNRSKPAMNYLHYKTAQEAMSRFHEVLSDLIEHYDLTRNSR